VAGNFHLAPGKSFQQGAMHVHDLIPFKDMNFNISHTIHKLTFGADFPGVQNPMNGVVRVMGKADGVGMYQYFIKVTTNRNQMRETSQKHQKHPFISLLYARCPHQMWNLDMWKKTNT
jgi:hypothetical protein